MRVFQLLGRQSTTSVLSISIVLLALIGWLDYRIGHELSLALFYLIPIGVVAWYSPRRPSLAVAVLSTLMWLSVRWFTDPLPAQPDLAQYLIEAWDTLTTGGFFVIIVYLLSSLKQTLAHERQLSRADPLTGVANRRAFYEVIAFETQRSARYGHPLTLIYLDVDDFKQINDRWGHHAGDQFLQSIAVALQQTLRRTDHIARLGGDEFALLLPETGGEAANMVMQKALQTLTAQVQQQHWPVTFSMGGVICADGQIRIDELLRYADVELYAAKRAGKNRISYHVLGVGK